MALTKTAAGVDAWQEINQNDVLLGAEIGIEGGYGIHLHIKCALSSTTAHTGTEIIVQVGTDTADAKDNWTTVDRFIGPVGTAVSLTLNDTELAGEVVLAVTNPVTANMDNDGKFKFIEHATPANSEIVFQKSNSGDAGDTITILDGLGHDQNSSSVIFDIDDSEIEAVGMYVVEIADTADRVRVIYNNKYDPDGATVFIECRITQTTGL